MKTKEEIIERLHKIDEEIRGYIGTRETIIYSSWWGRQVGSIKNKYYKDRYRVIALKSERKTLINKLKEISSQLPVNKNSQGYIVEGEDRQAVRYGAKLYIEEIKPQRSSKISKNRTVACKVVEKYFPELSGKLRDKKIDSLRAKIQLEVKKQMKIK